MLDVAAAALLEAFPRLFLQQLAAHLEGVAAPGGVEEVGCRRGPLLAVTIELLQLMRALGKERTAVVEEVVVAAVGEQREVVAEVAVTRFDIHLVAERPVPLGLVDPAAG